MPDIETLNFIGLIDPTTVTIPDAARRAKWLAVDITITARDNNIGTVDLEKTYPRIFSGYVYKLINNAIISCEPLLWERQRIYDVELERVHDFFLQGLSSQIDYLKGIDGNLNPFDEPTGLYGNGYQRFLAAIGELGECNRLKGHRIGSISVWIPPVVEYNVEIQWEPWCDLFTDLDDDGELEVSETAGYLIPEVPNSPLNQNPLIQGTFDEIARSKGYIPVEECETLPLINYKILFNVNADIGGGQGGNRSVVINTPNQPTVTVARYNPSSTAPIGNYLEAFFGDAPCSPSNPVSPTPSTATQWIVATINTAEETFYTLLYGTSVLAANPNATIVSNIRCN